MSRSVSFVRGAAVGAVGAGVLAGAMLIGPVAPAQAAPPVGVSAVTPADLHGGFAEKPWNNGHGWGHWGKHWFW
jgi:hypothetical protein